MKQYRPEFIGTFGRTRARRVQHARLPGSSLLLLLVLGLGACAYLSNRDPLAIDVAGIEPLPGEGMELHLAVKIRVQNPNDVAVNYTGVALALDLNGHNLATGVSDEAGTVPRYSERVFTIPVTISAFDVARQLIGFKDASTRNEVRYRVRGKLEGGVFGTRRFRDEGTFQFTPPTEGPVDELDDGPVL